MRRSLPLFALLLVPSIACRSSESTTGEPAAQNPEPAPVARAANSVDADFSVPEGLTVTEWAASPQLYNPTAMSIDAEGRVWVTEAVNYRQWDGRNAGRHHPEGDRVVVLEDTDGDGQCDSSTVFVQEPELVAPLGICVIGSDVYVSCSPDLIRYRDNDGDGKADEREVILTGFGGHDHDHGLHSVVPGPEGKLYFAVGNAGPHLVNGAYGFELRSGSLYTGGGEFAADNHPGLVSSDGKAWTGGLILRCDRDGGDLEVLAHNFRNQYEVALDSWGRMYTADNDDDGNQSCRSLFVLEGGNHGYFSADGTRYWNVDRREGQSIQDAHWHQDDPGVAPMGTITGAGGPTGVCVYEGTSMQEWISGAVLVADAGAGIVRAHRPVLAGAGVELRDGTLIEPRADSERASWFRPSDVCVGPDGAVYVADWYDPGVGGHWAGDMEGHGRILRIAPRDGGGEWNRLTAALGASSSEEAGEVWLDEEIEMLSAPSANLRMAALDDLGWSPATLELCVRAANSARDPYLQARGLAAALASPRGITAQLDQIPQAGLRALALRIGRAVGNENQLVANWEYLKEEEDAEVRREALLWLAQYDFSEMSDLFVELAALHKPGDRWHLEAIGIAVGDEAEHALVHLAPEIGDVPLRWDARYEELMWRLHPPSLLPAFDARARSPQLSRELRIRALDAIAFIDTLEAAQTMALLAQTGPEDLRPYARWWLTNRASNDWRGFDVGRLAASAGMEHAEEVWNSGAMKRGSTRFTIALENAQRMWLVVDPSTNGNGCDWADWIDPVLAVDGVELPLTDLVWVEAEAEWGSVRVGANCVGDPLSVDGVEQANGIGTHASSTVLYELPSGATRFSGRVALDDGGVNQGGSPEVVFRVFVERAADDTQLALHERTLLDASASPEDRERAARELSIDPRGAQRLLRLAQDEALDEAARIAAAPGLYASADLGVRALASEHFPRPGAAADWPSVEDLLALEGDAANGRELFFGERALCSRCHVVTRGDESRGSRVGPDLTKVRAKLGHAELYDAMLNPSAAIAFGYDSYLVVDHDGRTYTGFMLADGDVVVLEDTAGVRWSIERADIAELRKQKLSLMPQDVAYQLEPQEIADVVAFLREDDEAEPVAGKWQDLWSDDALDGWVWHGDGELDAVWSIADGVVSCEGSPIGYIRTEQDFTNFELELEWRFDPARGAGNSGVLLRMIGPDEVWPRSIEAQLMSGSAGDIWNIGEFPMVAKETRTSGRHTRRAQPSSEHELGAWNQYRIRLWRGSLTLEVNGVLQNTAEWCLETPGKLCLQSEGAPIQFRGLRVRELTSD